MKEKFSIEPYLYSLFKSLVGDNADNIKGVKGIGPKTAKEIVNTYQTFEELKEKYYEIEKKRIAEMIRENLNLIKTNLELIELKNIASIPYCIEELEYKDNGKTTNVVLCEIGIK